MAKPKKTAGERIKELRRNKQRLKEQLKMLDKTLRKKEASFLCAIARILLENYRTARIEDQRVLVVPVAAFSELAERYEDLRGYRQEIDKFILLLKQQKQT